MTPELLAVYEEDVIGWIENYRTLWENTGNPLYVWKAIGVCFMFGAARVESQTGVRPSPPGPEPYPFPDWCIRYIGVLSCRIDILTEGKDFRGFPEPFGNGASTPENWRLAQEVKPTIEPIEAAELIGAATGIVRGGWNAFDRLNALASKELDDLAMDSLRADGKSTAEAMDILLQESGTNDDSTMRRRIREARLAREAKPTP